MQVRSVRKVSMIGVSAARRAVGAQLKEPRREHPWQQSPDQAKPSMSTTATPAYRGWLKEAVRKVQADANRSADTHLLRFPMPERWGIDLYLKDESTHLTGSLKHRLARSLFLYGLCNGWIRRGCPVIEASSGSTAVSEAYFAKLIGVPFIAVMPRTTSAGEDAA
ncbi:hypothetical protein SALBM311S_06518 [Streptomyces alboniger]